MSTSMAEAAEQPFTSKIDDCIVEWFPKNRRVLFKRLADKGFRRRAIIDRARHLGLSDQFLKWCSINNPDLALRECLGCGERFLSVGYQNRLCRRCRDRR